MVTLEAPRSERALPRASGGMHARRAGGLVILIAALGLAIMTSFAVGANPLTLAEVWEALWRPSDSEASAVVWSIRAERTLVGLLTGAAFGVAGALIQAVTRNPLADPGILGVNAGAGFAVTIGVGIFGVAGISQYIWFAFVGAAVATVLVYLIGSGGRGAASPVMLVLAGVALGAVLGAMSSLLQLFDPETFESLRRWGVGSLVAATVDDVLAVLPFIVLGLVLALVLSSSLNSVALGDELATALGTNVPLVRAVAVVAITLLAGAGTAITGGIAFVGFAVPHVVRWIVGPDQRWIIAYSTLAAPSLVLFADVLGRIVARPGEIEVGIVTAVIGAPLLIALVRRSNASGL